MVAARLRVHIPMHHQVQKWGPPRPFMQRELGKNLLQHLWGESSSQCLCFWPGETLRFLALQLRDSKLAPSITMQQRGCQKGESDCPSTPTTNTVPIFARCGTRS